MSAVNAPLPKRSRVGQGAKFLPSLRKKLNRALASSNPGIHAAVVPRARQKLREGIALRIALGLYGALDLHQSDPIPTEAELATGRRRVHRQQESHAARIRLAESRAALLAANAAVADAQTPQVRAAAPPFRATSLLAASSGDAPAAAAAPSIDEDDLRRSRVIDDDDDDDEDEEVFGSDDEEDVPSPPRGAASPPPRGAAPFVPELPVAATTASTHPIPLSMRMAQAFPMPLMPAAVSVVSDSPELRRASSLDHLLEQLPPNHPAVAVVKEPLTAVGNAGLESQEQRLLDQVGGAILELSGLKRQREKLVAIVAMQHNAQTALEMANTDLQKEAVEAEEEHASKVQRVRDAAREAATNESKAALDEALRVAEHNAENAETLRRRITELEGELNAEKGRSNYLRADLNDLQGSSCCQMCNDTMGSMINVDTGSVDSKLAVCTGGPGNDQHIMCARCLNEIFRNRIDESNLSNLPCVHCPVGGCFNLDGNLDLLSPGTVAKYHEVKINKEVAQRTAAVEAAASANGSGSAVTLSEQELATLPQSVQEELRRARAREHALADARTMKAPCCGRPFADFDGCICLKCECGRHFCGLCFACFDSDDAVHEHVRRDETTPVTYNNRHSLPLREGIFDYERLPEAQRPPTPTELKPCPCHPRGEAGEPFYFSSEVRRRLLNACWEARVLSQMPKPFEGHSMEDPQGDH